MANVYPGEVWKEVNIDINCNNKPILEVSNFGRVRTSNKLHTKKIIKGSMINGYAIIRLKFFQEKNKEKEVQLQQLKNELTDLTIKVKTLKLEDAPPATIEECSAQLDKLKAKFKKEQNKALLGRTIYYHSLVHKLVATAFCKRPSEDHSVIGHLDFNKLNNRSYNLKWMTPAENYEHQKSSPNVIQEKANRRDIRRENHTGTTKLTVTKVMMLKKLLSQGKSINMLAKSFKVTNTQIKRIMNGENWKDVEAAK